MAQTTLLLSFFFCGTALSSTALAQDPQLMSLVMPDAKILAGINATNVESSTFGQFIISKVGSGGAQLQQFTEATGFNPLQDVTEVLAATAADPANPGGLLLVRGNFKLEKILPAVSSKPNVQVQNPTQNSTDNQAITLISVTNPNQKVAHAVAFIGTTIAVAGDLPSVQAALNRVNSGSTIDSTLMSQASQLSTNEDEWLASITSLASLAPQKPPAAVAPNPGLQTQVLPVLKSVQSFHGGVKFGDTVQFTGEATSTDANSANSLAAVIKLAEVMISSSSPAASDPRGADFIQILQSLQVTTNGTAVNVSLSVPESQVEALLNTPASHARPALPRNQKNGANPGN